MHESELQRSSQNAPKQMVAGRASLPLEESSKLNLLIDEYRRENDRCSRRINELQSKLNNTSNRR